MSVPAVQELVKQPVRTSTKPCIAIQLDVSAVNNQMRTENLHGQLALYWT